jgi:hypothetical protein
MKHRLQVQRVGGYSEEGSDPWLLKIFSGVAIGP